MSFVLKSASAVAALSLLGGCFLSDPNPETTVVVETPPPVVVEQPTGKF